MKRSAWLLPWVLLLGAVCRSWNYGTLAQVGHSNADLTSIHHPPNVQLYIEPVFDCRAAIGRCTQVTGDTDPLLLIISDRDCTICIAGVGHFPKADQCKSLTSEQFFDIIAVRFAPQIES